MVPRARGVQGTICICPEQLGMAHFLSKLLTKGNLDFSRFGLRIKEWLSNPAPPPPARHGEIWILADLDSGSKVGQPPPPSTRHREIWNLANLDSGSKVGWPTPPPPPFTEHREICTQLKRLARDHLEPSSGAASLCYFRLNV